MSALFFKENKGLSILEEIDLTNKYRRYVPVSL